MVNHVRLNILRVILKLKDKIHTIWPDWATHKIT